MRDYITYAVTLVTITNPLGTMAFFAGFVADRSDAQKRVIARQTGLAVAIIIVVVTWAGAGILAFFGIVPAGLQAAGGIILILMGLSMLNSETPKSKTTKKERAAADEKESPGVVPLALPITIGPGAMTTIILGTQTLPNVRDRFALTAIGLAIAFVIWLTLHFSTALTKVLGQTGIGVVTRIGGLLLIAIAFQMLAQGLGSLLPGLAS